MKKKVNEGLEMKMNVMIYSSLESTHFLKPFKLSIELRTQKICGKKYNLLRKGRLKNLSY